MSSSVHLPPLDLRSGQPHGVTKDDRSSTFPKGGGGIRSERRLSTSPLKKRYHEIATATTREYNYLEPNSDRNTAQHNICVEILMGGHVEAFIEIFGVTSSNLDGDSREDLRIMENNLTQAEIASREGDYETVFMSYKRIGDHFEESNQLKRSRHFRLKAQHAAEALGNLDRLALAHNGLGLIEEKLGDTEMAVACFEDMYNASMKHNADISVACHNLIRTKTRLAEEREETKDLESALTHLKSALEYAQKLDNPDHSSLCFYRLGRMSELLGDADSAIQYLESYMSLSPTPKGRNLACMVLARCYERRGDLQTVIVYLEKLVTSSEELDQHSVTTDSAAKLGSIHGQIGNHADSIQWYTKAYSTSRKLNDPARVLELRIALGQVRAGAMQQGFVKCLVQNSASDVNAVLRWKSYREDAFSGKIDCGYAKPKVDVALPTSPMNDGEGNEAADEEVTPQATET